MPDIAQILNKARTKRLKIVTAESCTGGLVAAALTEIAGSSDVFERGFVTYSNDAKQQMLGVQLSKLNDFGAVSRQVATEMAAGALQRSNADLAVAITGIAGPGPSEHKPEGRVCFALAQRDHNTKAQTHEFGAIGRSQVRQQATQYALNILLRAIEAS